MTSEKEKMELDKAKYEVFDSLFVIPYFDIMLTKKKLWAAFKVAEASKTYYLQP